MTMAVEDDNITQIVILGAGYDCRFYRLDCIRKVEKLTLIEVDQQEVWHMKYIYRYVYIMKKVASHYFTLVLKIIFIFSISLYSSCN